MRLLTAAGLAGLVLLAACNGGSTPPTPTPSPTVAPTATPAPTPSPSAHGSSELGPVAFDPARAFAHVEALALDIGPRPAGSDAEDKAARYLRDQLQAFGYEIELQPFSFDVFVDAGSGLEVLSPQAPSPAVFPFDPSANGVVEGPLVGADIGRPDDFPADTAGKIALIQRGTLRFSEKVANAAAAGAVGAVIYNNQPGLFAGNFSELSEIPAVAMSQEDGEALLAKTQSGPVSVRLTVLTETGPRDSQNVIARPPDGECRVVAGGHYDSVPGGPGANDNASGTATVVEMARVLAADGEFDDVCFVLFGAEEVGLIGSSRFVDRLTSLESETLEAMLNFDMVGVGTNWLLSGSLSITDIAVAEAEERGLDYIRSSSDMLGSDHAPFAAAGIPAIFLHSFFDVVADDPRYHTAEDQPQHVEPSRMGEIGDAGLAVIEELLRGR
ncbi:MAG: M20/M25/M40 family metallo-hydrolase [Chloroflexi bacterium]|nr:M20/M25/M40 family metallo-hydrolase [Chloroflexota bacterium]